MRSVSAFVKPPTAAMAMTAKMATASGSPARQRAQREPGDRQAEDDEERHRRAEQPEPVRPRGGDPGAVDLLGRAQRPDRVEAGRGVEDAVEGDQNQAADRREGERGAPPLPPPRQDRRPRADREQRPREERGDRQRGGARRPAARRERPRGQQAEREIDRVGRRGAEQQRARGQRHQQRGDPRAPLVEQLAGQQVGERAAERADPDAQRRHPAGRVDPQGVKGEQQPGRMAGGVHRQRGHELGEAVDEEAGAEVERAERGQVLVRALEAAPGRTPRSTARCRRSPRPAPAGAPA